MVNGLITAITAERGTQVDEDIKPFSKCGLFNADRQNGNIYITAKDMARVKTIMICYSLFTSHFRVSKSYIVPHEILNNILDDAR